MNEVYGQSEEQLKAVVTNSEEAACRNKLHLQTLYNETEGSEELKSFLEEGFFNPAGPDLAEAK